MRTADDERARLIDDLVRDGRVYDPRIRAALDAVPRHLFLPGLDPGAAYADEAVPIKTDGGVTVSSVSQPSMVAIMLEQLAPAPGHRVLEIGAGAGWNAGLLAHVVGPAGSVTTVDIDADLVDGTRDNLAAAGVQGVTAVVGDGAGGYPAAAPYDRIELTVGSTGVRPEWVTQLTPDGRLLLPLTVRGSQLSVAFDRTGPDRLVSASVRSCAFVRLRGAGADPGADAALPGGGWTVQPAGRDVPGTADLPTLERVLREPGGDRAAPAPGSVSDLWDGLGLWCALADPGVLRLLGPEDSRLGPALFAVAGARAALGIATAEGCALLLADPAATVRAFGPDGDAAAERLLALADGWVRAGRPHAADLRIEAVVPAPGDGPAPGEIVDTAGTRLRISWGTGPG
ncbi:methyltransferase domain-containing protein [Pseudonocardia sp. HH130630-07]|uniref:methyltransferase domain-containing protein n=1 Tax=Pseudonocardia sp. HH130630-07 TaxID=1690815 RepID=UPI00081505D4|nr:methyltransferase domain-containing protein [Pseudonocardia sp. HH130630-07]ANY05459.1 protein-L-isoaspartate(D-aspartate) O-methyltransferase [Pseudonocardia sp. HH130630-07]